MYLTNNSSYSVVSGSSDSDTIYNYGSHVTVNGYSENDNIVSFGEGYANDYEGDVEVYGGNGNDSLLPMAKQWLLTEAAVPTPFM